MLEPRDALPVALDEARAVVLVLADGLPDSVGEPLSRGVRLPLGVAVAHEDAGAESEPPPALDEAVAVVDAPALRVSLFEKRAGALGCGIADSAWLTETEFVLEGGVNTAVPDDVRDGDAVAVALWLLDGVAPREGVGNMLPDAHALAPLDGVADGCPDTLAVGSGEPDAVPPKNESDGEYDGMVPTGDADTLGEAEGEKLTRTDTDAHTLELEYRLGDGTGDSDSIAEWLADTTLEAVSSGLAVEIAEAGAVALCSTLGDVH